MRGAKIGYKLYFPMSLILLRTHSVNKRDCFLSQGGPATKINPGRLRILKEYFQLKLEPLVRMSAPIWMPMYLTGDP